MRLNINIIYCIQQQSNLSSLLYPFCRIPQYSYKQYNSNSYLITVCSGQWRGLLLAHHQWDNPARSSDCGRGRHPGAGTRAQSQLGRGAVGTWDCVGAFCVNLFIVKQQRGGYVSYYKNKQGHFGGSWYLELVQSTKGDENWCGLSIIGR